MLSCSCDDWDGDGWAWEHPIDFEPLETSKRKRGCSCKKLIGIGADCLEFERFRYPKNDIEDRIYGEQAEIYLASWYMCDKCGEIYLNLDALGYCISIEIPMREYLAAYHEVTGFKVIT